MNLSSTKSWCSDNLHELLGFTDSALAGFLVDVASNIGRSKKRHGDGGIERVLNTLREGGVKADEVRLLHFARELCRRCGSGSDSVAAATTTASTAATTMTRQYATVTNAEMMKRAANYSLMEMEEPELTFPAKTIVAGSRSNESVPGTIVTNSSKSSDSKRSSMRAAEDNIREKNKLPPPPPP